MQFSESPGFSDRSGYGYWTVGGQASCDEGVICYRARPSGIGYGQFGYRLFVVDHQRGCDPAQAIERVANRSATASMISHQSMMPLIDAELDRPPFFWVEPELGWPTAADLVCQAEFGPFRAVRVLRQVAQLATIAHDGCRTAGSLEPHNIHVSVDGRVLLSGLDRSQAFGTGRSVACQSVVPFASVRCDLFRIGRLMQWMVDKVNLPSLDSLTFGDSLRRLARWAIRTSGEQYANAESEFHAILNQILNLETEYLLESAG